MCLCHRTIFSIFCLCRLRALCIAADDRQQSRSRPRLPWRWPPMQRAMARHVVAALSTAADRFDQDGDLPSLRRRCQSSLDGKHSSPDTDPQSHASTGRHVGPRSCRSLATARSLSPHARPLASPQHCRSPEESAPSDTDVVFDLGSQRPCRPEARPSPRHPVGRLSE